MHRRRHLAHVTTGPLPDDDCLFHQIGETLVAVHPRHHYLLDRSVPVFHTRHFRFNDRCRLTGVQISPPPPRPLVHRRGIPTLRMKPLLRPINLHSDHHPVGGHFQVNVADTPRGLQSENMTVKFGALHQDQSDNRANCCKNSHRKSPRTITDTGPDTIFVRRASIKTCR